MNKLTTLIEAAKAATPGPWSTDTLENDGDYGQGPDDVHSGFKSYGVLSSHNRILFDSLNRDPSMCEVHEDTYTEHRYAWDELAKRDAEFIALANPATILELCALLEKAEEALDKCSVQLTRLGYSCNHADAGLAAAETVNLKDLPK